mmetsp:Transcript_15193/g.23458  ORF Transcript_15193/g.23458 Transcript_15193/m.23458 type:complete len:219 (+) Transcript_15193:981-1637(+)
MEQTKAEAEDHKRCDEHGEPLEEAVGTVVQDLGGGLVDEGLDDDNVESVTHDPEHHELGAEHHVLRFELLLLVHVLRQGIGAGRGLCCRRTVAPGEIVQVGHRVNGHQVGEGGQHHDVDEHTHDVGFEVEEEVHRSEDDREQVHAEHDDSTDGQRGEVLGVELMPVAHEAEAGLVVDEYLFVRIKGLLLKEDNNTYEREHREYSEDASDKLEVADASL